MDFEKLCGHAPVGICYFDADLRYVYVNDWLATLNGLPVQQHLGQKIGDILPNVAADVEGELRRVLETGEPLLQAEVQLENAAHAGSKR
jgi:PAS domain-containing protein